MSKRVYAPAWLPRIVSACFWGTGGDFQRSKNGTHTSPGEAAAGCSGPDGSVGAGRHEGPGRGPAGNTGARVGVGVTSCGSCPAVGGGERVGASRHDGDDGEGRGPTGDMAAGRGPAAAIG